MLALQFPMDQGPIGFRPRRRTWLSAAFAVSRSSSPLSLSPSGSGQLKPAARHRPRVARTVDGALPVRRAISRTDSYQS